MAIKHNNAIPRNHFRKDWQRRVKTHFNQPGRKQRRRQARVIKANQCAPRPVDKLRPIVRCPTIRYNMKVRTGRGFSLDELKEAGVGRDYAKTIGISVDHRRRNKSEEGFSANVARIKEYLSKLIVFPRRNGKVKNGDSDKAATSSVDAKTNSNTLAAPVNKPVFEERKITEEERAAKAFVTLREARSDKRQRGKREKRQKDKEEKDK